MVDSELADTDDLTIAAFARWMVALGDASHTLVTWDVADPSLRAMGQIDRLELTGYDPGGLRRVRMVRVDDESVLVETEVGLALVRFGGFIVWQFVHDDITSRIRGVHDGVVEVRSESALSRFAISDGAYLGGEPIDVSEV